MEECTEESHPKVETVDEGYLQRLLKLSPSAMNELSKISTLDFNIFRIQLETSQNELTTTISYLLAKEQIFSRLPIQFGTFQRFINKIQSGYKNITYHNKTHGADLA